MNIFVLTAVLAGVIAAAVTLLLHEPSSKDGRLVFGLKAFAPAAVAIYVGLLFCTDISTVIPEIEMGEPDF